MRLYISCHDDASQAQANDLVRRWNCPERGVSFEVLRLPSPGTPFMESAAFGILETRACEWEGEDFVGVLTYSVLTKMKKFSGRNMDCDWVSLRNRATMEGFDVVSLFGMEYRRHEKRISVLEGSVFQHGLSYFLAWKELLSRLGYTASQIEEAGVDGFFCNWWFARPGAFMDYCRFYGAARRVALTDREVSVRLARDAGYKSGNMSAEQRLVVFGGPEYTLHPFVFERLPPFYFHHRSKGLDREKRGILKIGAMCRFVMRV